MSRTREYGEPGHFCAANNCRWHRHTHVDGKWCISTVGEYFPSPIRSRGQTERVQESLGANGRLYETALARLTPDGDTADLDVHDGYWSRDAANDGHDEWVRKALDGELESARTGRGR